ncbi:hypothetical protein CVT25_006708 [Psilocybe cyanescens]|uniref:MULE transposase domain-containing protein n=1 Tax=Psilocybe cyanescens TaxID=93625 RepID=A0A409XE25_PSICY|nr:hypothetical protein CVT25_006708 [Psilocybe cyanescens]
MSSFVRQNILELASLANMTASQIKLRLLSFCETHQVPRYRWPTPSQVNNVVQNVHRRDRLLNDPLLAIGLFAKKNPEKIFYYSPPNYDTNPPSKFATGIQHPFAIQSLILWSHQNGIGLDSSYRHKNENRAPVTFITTIDENHHMLPGPVFVSADATAETLVLFLRKVKELAEKTATQLMSEKIEIDYGLVKYKKALLQEAAKIVKSKWWPHFIMIDKSRAERSAIQKVFPNIPIRICQFHVMQAILRWDKEVELCVIYSAVALRKDGKEQLKSLKSLFGDFALDPLPQEEKLSDFWTDIGLPAGENREKMLSTNNWTERAFKTFDQVFLASRANKLAYRLVLIIANQWFNYYREWKNDKPRFNKEEFAKDNKAYEIWSREKGIIEFKTEDGLRAWKIVDI